MSNPDNNQSLYYKINLLFVFSAFYTEQQIIFLLEKLISDDT